MKPWRMLTWAFIVIALGIAGVGIVMVFGSESDATIALGAGLASAAVVGIAILGAQLAFSQQLASVAEKRAAQAERESLRVQLGSGTQFPGIDLRNKDLQGFYLWQRDLAHAVLSGADLSGACLVGANLSGAGLDRANLHRANLRRAELSNATFRSANLLHSAYDESTTWPELYRPQGVLCTPENFRPNVCDIGPTEDHYHHVGDASVTAG